MIISGHKTRSVFDRYNIVSEQDLADAVRKLQKFQDAAEPACQPAQAESSTPADRQEFVNCKRARSEKDCSIKRDVNKKASPSAGSREIFCLDIQPTVCRWLSIAREVLLWIALPFLGSFSSGDSAGRFLKLGKRFNSVATMVLSEA